MAKKEKRHEGPVGGLVFYTSLILLILISILNISILPGTFTDLAIPRWISFGAGSLVGIVATLFLIRGPVSVFIHELKHSVVSNLVGNKAKKMKIRAEDGFFEYSFSKETAHMNAFISLAPYFLPLFLVPTICVTSLLIPHESAWLPFLAGIAFAGDIILNIREIGPWQTDLTGIRGGFGVALTYVAAVNLAIITFLVVWISGGSDGIIILGKGWMDLGFGILGTAKNL